MSRAGDKECYRADSRCINPFLRQKLLKMTLMAQMLASFVETREQYAPRPVGC
jgi:hypothetical protein